MGHWYTKEGEAKHWIEGANGKQRDTTLRDAKKLGLLPSVTTILGVVDKPALTNWKLKQVSRACFEDPGQGIEAYPDYHNRMMANAFEDSTDARDRGSEIHAALESLFLNPEGDDSSDIMQIARAAYLAVVDYTDGAELEPEKIVVGDGYAGMCDLSGPGWVIDFKTKDLEPGRRNQWPEMAMQLAAYAMALDWPLMDCRCANVFIDRTEPGNLEIYEWSPEDIDVAWRKFCLLRDFWQLDKGYRP